MARETIDPGHPGTWPGGEPQTVRDAYDTMLTAPSTPDDTNDRTGRGPRRAGS